MRESYFPYLLGQRKEMQPRLSETGRQPPTFFPRGESTLLLAQEEISPLKAGTCPSSAAQVLAAEGGDAPPVGPDLGSL